MMHKYRTTWTLIIVAGLCGLGFWMLPQGSVTAGEPEPGAEKPAKVDHASPGAPDAAAAAEPAEESHSVGQKIADAPLAEPNLDAASELSVSEPQATADNPAQTDEGAQIGGASAGAPELSTVGGASPAPALEQQGPQGGDLRSTSGKEAGGPRDGGPRAPIFDAATLKLSFQAYLTDNGGVVLPGPTVDLEFNIYTGGGGLVEGPIAMAGVSISDGVVDVLVPVSAASFDGSERLMGVTVNPPAVELAPRIPLVSVPYALRVNRVASAELDDNIDLGDAATDGSLTVYSAFSGGPGIFLFGASGTISTYGSDGLEQTRLWNGSWGELLLWDGSVTNDQTVVLSATSNAGGQLTLRDATGVGGNSVFLDGGTGTVNAAGSLNAVNTIGGTVQGSLYPNSAFGAWLDLKDETGALTIRAGASNTAGGGFINLNQADGDLGAVVDGDATTNAGGEVKTYQADGGLGAVLDGDETGADGGGALRVHNAAGSQTVDVLGSAGTVSTTGDIGTYSTLAGTLLGRIDKHGGGSWFQSYDTTGSQTGIFGTSAGGDGGFAQLHNNSGVLTVRIDGDDANAGLIEVSDIAGADRVRIDGESTGTGGEISVFDNDGTETVEILGAETSTQGAQILLRKADGTTTIEIDGDFNGDGRIITQELQITGGSDLSEQFDVRNSGGEVKSGIVVCIDPTAPGKLMVSSKRYDRRVAGIISGAGGVDTGMYMGQKGTPADGSHPVALTGRVYCWVDASHGPVEPGDLLTTSDTPGHAMKVTEHAQSQGAILGKAMTPLADGKGLVLVLVSLQ